MKKEISLLIVLLFLLWDGCRPGSEKGEGYTIAVIPKGTTHVFWKSIHAGAVKAEREFSESGIPVNLIWKGPLLEDDRAGQISVVENFIGRKVDGVVLAPLDREALVPAAQKCNAAGIPVVIVDSSLNYDGYVSFAATDNYRGGKMAGEELARLLRGRGKVILLRLQVGSASTTAREKGFLDEIAKHAGMKVLSSNQYGGATRETAFTASQNLLNRFGREVDGIFTPNESTTNGMLLALRSIGRSKSVKFIGFDGGAQNIGGLREGDIDGIIIQNPFLMGYLGVKLIVDHIQGRETEKRIDTGVELVTRNNFEDPEIQALLFPAVDEYLE